MQADARIRLEQKSGEENGQIDKLWNDALAMAHTPSNGPTDTPPAIQRDFRKRAKEAPGGRWITFDDLVEIATASQDDQRALSGKYDRQILQIARPFKNRVLRAMGQKEAVEDSLLGQVRSGTLQIADITPDQLISFTEEVLDAAADAEDFPRLLNELGLNEQSFNNLCAKALGEPATVQKDPDPSPPNGKSNVQVTKASSLELPDSSPSSVASLDASLQKAPLDGEAIFASLQSRKRVWQDMNEAEFIALREAVLERCDHGANNGALRRILEDCNISLALFNRLADPKERRRFFQQRSEPRQHQRPTPASLPHESKKVPAPSLDESQEPLPVDLSPVSSKKKVSYKDAPEKSILDDPEALLALRIVYHILPSYTEDNLEDTRKELGDVFGLSAEQIEQFSETTPQLSIKSQAGLAHRSHHPALRQALLTLLDHNECMRPLSSTRLLRCFGCQPMNAKGWRASSNKFDLQSVKWQGADGAELEAMLPSQVSTVQTSQEEVQSTSVAEPDTLEVVLERERQTWGELDALRASHIVLQQTHAELEKRFGSMQQHRERLEQRNAALERNNAGLQAQVTSVEQEHAALQQIHQTILEQHTAMEAIVQRLEAQVGELQTSMVKMPEQKQSANVMEIRDGTGASVLRIVIDVQVPSAPGANGVASSS